MSVAITTQIGPMAEDRLWTAYCDWADLIPLFNNPQAWVKDLKDARGHEIKAVLADGVITIIVLYPLDQNEPPPLHKLVVQGGDFASVLQVRALTTDGMFQDLIALHRWLPPSGATYTADGDKRPLPPGAVIELPNGTILKIPINEVQFTLRPTDNLGFLHFPVNVAHVGEVFAEIAQNPQRLVTAIRKWVQDGGKPRVTIEEGTTIDQEIEDVSLLDLDIAALRKLCLVYQSGTPEGYGTCTKVGGSLKDLGKGAFGFAADIVVGYRY